MENKSHALAAGLFIIIATTLLAALALWLTRDTADYMFYELSSSESVSGLQPQAAVNYKGVTVGKVTHIGFDPQTTGNVLIHIAVNTSTPMSDTTFAMLGYQGVTGLAHIQLDDSPTPVQVTAGDSGLSRLPLHTSPLSRLTTQGPLLLAQLQETATRINQLLGESNQKHFGRALEQLGNAAGSVDMLARQLEHTVTTRLNPALATVPEVAQDARTTLQALHQAGNNAAAAAEEVSHTVRALNAEGGTLDTIARSAGSLSAAAEQFSRVSLPRLHQAADETAQAARRMGRTAAGIGDNPQSLIYGAPRTPAGPGEAGFAPPPSQSGAEVMTTP